MLKLKAKQTVPILIALVVLSGGLSNEDAQAHRRDFPFTYDWMQPSQGEKEIEPQTLYRRGDHAFEQQIEFEYGFTDRFMIAPYVVLEKGSGGSLKYAAWKLESRYQLGQYKEGKILTGLYMEAEKPKGEKLEVEGKLIFSRYDKQGGNLSLNLIGEKSLESGSNLLTTFSMGYARPLGKGSHDRRGGFELMRDLDDKHISAGPVFGMELGRHVNFVAGYGFPITKRNVNKGELRLLAEYEWF